MTARRTFTNITPPDTTRRDDWRDDAACSGNPEDFYPADGDHGAAKRAKAICHDCPVKMACLEEAMTTRERFGVWGGTTEREREVMRRSLGKDNRTRCGRGHDLAKVGTSKAGQCKECRNVRARARRAEVAAS